MTPHAGPPTSALALVVVAALATWLGQIATTDAPHVRAIACARAVLLDDRLRCDDEAPRTLAELCSPDHPDASRSIEAGDRIDVARVCAGERAGHGRMVTADLRALSVPIDVNHAPIDELRSLPGIGPVLAERIVAGRPYERADDLDRVRGIGPKTLARLRPRLRVAPR